MFVCLKQKLNSLWKAVYFGGIVSWEQGKVNKPEIGCRNKYLLTLSNK